MWSQSSCLVQVVSAYKTMEISGSSTSNARSFVEWSFAYEGLWREPLRGRACTAGEKDGVLECCGHGFPRDENPLEEGCNLLYLIRFFE